MALCNEMDFDFRICTANVGAPDDTDNGFSIPSTSVSSVAMDDLHGNFVVPCTSADSGGEDYNHREPTANLTSQPPTYEMILK